MESSNYKLIIVGAGAAGLMAAAYLSTALSSQDSTPWQEPQVLLLEKMPRAARKLNITGKGRCNLTNARHWDEFCIHIHPNPNFLKSAFYNFSSSDCMAFVRALLFSEFSSPVRTTMKLVLLMLVSSLNCSITSAGYDSGSFASRA